MVEQHKIRGLIYGLIACYVTAVFLMIGTAFYANLIVRESNHKLCGIVLAFDETYRMSPPQTPIGQRLAIELHKLKKDFKC